MDALFLLSPSPEPPNEITDPANSIGDNEMMKNTKPPNLGKRKLINKGKQKEKEIMNKSDEASSSSSFSSSSTSNLNSTKRVSRVARRSRNPTVRLGIARRSVGERQAEALALPLGMSFAAFANLVLERKNAPGQNVYVDDLAMISASAVTESLSNVYGNKLGSFATNFEKSFNSTLKILKLINESTFRLENNNVGSYNLERSIDGCSDTELSGKETSSATPAYEAIQGSVRPTSPMNEIVLHEETLQLSGVSRSSAMSLTTFERSLEEQARANESTFRLENNNVGSYNLERSIDGCSDTELSGKETSSATPAYEAIQGSVRPTSPMNETVLHEETLQLSGVSRSSAMSLTTFERSLEEQARANDLKSMEIGLTMRKLKLKETELALSYESNNLGKSKLEMGVSKAAFRAEKFKTELEDTRKADMVTKIMDWLVVSVFNMLASMLYGAYVFSQQRITEAASICEPSEEKSSAWWVPKQVSLINTEFTIMLCRLRVWVQSFFGVLMIIVFTYFIIQRASGTKQTMPVTFIVLFLGIVCGLPGKFCVDTLGGNGKLWLVLWEMFCLLQFVANVFTLSLYGLIYGPITVTQETKPSRYSAMFPYWARRSFFFGLILLVLPVINGLLPFATFGEWRDHFSVLMYADVGGSVSHV